MKQLYTTVLGILKNQNVFAFIDYDTGQLFEEKPPIDYPAALIEIGLINCEDMGGNSQLVTANIQIKIITKSVSETHNMAPNSVLQRGLSFLDLYEKIYKALQGYEDDHFYKFSRKYGRISNVRKGLKVFELSFETSYHDHSAN